MTVAATRGTEPGLQAGPRTFSQLKGAPSARPCGPRSAAEGCFQHTTGTV